MCASEENDYLELLSTIAAEKCGDNRTPLSLTHILQGQSWQLYIGFLSYEAKFTKLTVCGKEFEG